MPLLEYGERDDGQIKGLGKEYGRNNERNQRDTRMRELC
jgi:hypothetical protein